MKNWLKVLLLAAFTMILVAGCSTKAPGSSEEPATSGENKEAPATDSMKLGLSISTLNNPFFVTLRDGAEAEAKKQGIQITTIDAQNDPAKQISDIEDLIQQGVTALIINPTDSAAVVSAIESANNAGIPVITVDRSAEGGEVVAHIASDNAAGGKMAGEFILETLGNKGKIVELEGIPGSSAARERGEGFHSAVDGVEGVKVVAKQAADFDRAKGLTVMENILQGNKDIQAVFAHNDEMALGALEALAAAGLKDVLVVGFDATEDAVKAVEDGRMGATVAQKPDLIGQKGVETAISVIKGEKVEEFIPVELELIK
ncbi:ribose ABC transporter substrate-binding protein RbsB [Schinkia azotoformans]|uniref:ribose ABC transporter substrate-binding protein RbsB n=1 Tax=Schinkia azotoformans TaxID=1454 RepID=UPI002DBAD947|nr:ribose ABC transporter substrate-binding protein RbsB [Schinkia azotoformans]MEC1716357.1 ribose ABC transporter substrate-binding protein RbsB [Schinkia azotoformans]MEC1740020.1 ribose ABC transporter substrate-binding protein RbsB [Schinkia azotoformans]MEC1746345.1 ribose ABC transporter substrate-binding protein RbsB [Schinkia azotoformans]MEC1759757.1 ribose ABC transporter substrate-binding protein RbsB [Schinkia azotoformans]MEC1766548.1 ribose ABC transporter substrate-binding prot